jgi:hypothetical protein
MLRELQADLRAAILGADAGIADAIEADGIASAARVAIYRHHVFTSLTDALASTYPVVCRLVDRRFFGYAADRFIREHPPASPCLFDYGAAVPDFLAAFPPCRHLGYLPDVARLEWAMNRALYAAAERPVGAATLAALPADVVAASMFALHPSVTLLDSPWPVDAIWRANQPDATDATVDVDAGAVRLQVWRAGEDVVYRRLSAAEAALRQAIAAPRPLGDAAEAALAADPTADLPALLRELLDEPVLVERAR